MGKKKSVALIVLVTVVLLGLLFISITPTFPVKTPYSLQSLLNTVRLGADLGGGYGAVYYPEGVISAEEYAGEVARYESGEGSDPAEQYVAHGGVYLDSEKVLDENGEVLESFKTEFETASRIFKQRFEDKNFTECSVWVEDDYTIRVEVSDVSQKETVSNVFSVLAYSGELYFSDTDTSTNSKNVLMTGGSEHISGADVVDMGDSGYGIAVHLTKAGRAKFAEITGDLVSSSSSDSSGSTSATLYLYMGTEVLMSAGVDSALDQNVIYIGGSSSSGSVAYPTRESAQTIACVINSALNEEDVFNLSLQPQVYSYGATMGDYAALIAASVIGVLVLAMIVFSLVRYKGMGLAHVYGFLTFALIFILCLAFITQITVNVAGLLAIVLSAAMMVDFNFYAFRNIRSEFYTGKTLTSAIKSGYKKSLAVTIDTHIILLIASIVLYFISLGSAQYMALIFLIGTVISAACTLAVTRFYLYMFLAQPKNKIAFCNFKREETEDE